MSGKFTEFSWNFTTCRGMLTKKIIKPKRLKVSAAATPDRGQEKGVSGEAI